MGVDVVAHDAEPFNPVMKVREARGVELFEPAGNDATEAPQVRLQEPMRAQGDAVHENVTAAKGRRVIDQVVDSQSDAGIERRENRTRAHARHHVDGNSRPNDPSQHAEMRGTAQAPCAQHDADIICTRLKNSAHQTNGNTRALPRTDRVPFFYDTLMFIAQSSPLSNVHLISRSDGTPRCLSVCAREHDVLVELPVQLEAAVSNTICRSRK